jgi:peptidyl-prolyl cis-trans isomerase B (cyclophilin B)
LIILALFALFLGGACKEKSSSDESNLVLKPIDDLTSEDIKRMEAVVQTNYGVFRFKLFPEDSPNTARSFIKLTREGFYNGLEFFHVMPRVIVVGGCPKGDGSGGPGYTLDQEPNERRNFRGTVGLLHPPNDPNGGGSQFYILLADDFRLDGLYTVFGKVISGMETLDRISDLPNTGKNGRPSPFKPLRPVIIENLSLEVAGNP